MQPETTTTHADGRARLAGSLRGDGIAVARFEEIFGEELWREVQADAEPFLAAVEAGCLSLVELLAALSTRPAALIGEERGMQPGAAAELVVFDRTARWRVDRESLASRSANTPLIGMSLPGVVRLTVAGGRVTFDEGIGLLV